MNRTACGETMQLWGGYQENGTREEYEYDIAGQLIESRSDCRCRRKTYTYDGAGNKLTLDRSWLNLTRSNLPRRSPLKHHRGSIVTVAV
jgi:hypothetical protein